MTIPVAAPEDFRELAEWIASLGEPGQKDFTERLHPRDEHGRFAETAGGRSWDGFPFDERKGEGPRPGDTPPQRTADGDYVMYHGTSPAGADAIRREGIHPDDAGTVGLATTPGAARIYGLLHAGADAQVLEVTVSKDWLEAQRASHEIGGSGHDQFLIQPAHGHRGDWGGLPRDAVLDIRVAGEVPDYRETWRPVMTPEEGHAWAEAAGTKLPQTVVHMTSKPAVDGIKGTGFDMSQMAVHEAGRYFALDPDAAQFYEYKGKEAVSTVVVCQNPVVLDWRESDLISAEAQSGNFRAAALEAAGFDLTDPGAILDAIGRENVSQMIINDIEEVITNAVGRSEFLRDATGYIADDAGLTTAALRAKGYDSVIIYPLWSPEDDPTTGGQQVIVFDREQAVVIGTESVPSWEAGRNQELNDYESRYVEILNTEGQEAADAWRELHPYPDRAAIERAFAKDFVEHLHPRDSHGRFTETPGGAPALEERSAVMTPEGKPGYIHHITTDLEGRVHVGVITIDQRNAGAALPYFLEELKPLDTSDKVQIYDSFGHEANDRFLSGNFVVGEDGKVRGVLSDQEVRSAQRTIDAVAPPFNEGDRVVATTGDIGTLVRVDYPAGMVEAESDTVTIKLDDGRILADVTKGLQHAGTWKTPAGWEAAGVDGASGRAREVYPSDDGSGRIYAIEYPGHFVQDANTIKGMRAALASMVNDNHALEKDSGLHNAWRGTVIFGQPQDMTSGELAHKDWNCSITLGVGVVRDIKETGTSHWNPKDGEDARLVMIHELTHGLSNVKRREYIGNTAMEEGVVDGYAKAFVTVEAYGRQERIFTQHVERVAGARVPGGDSSGYPAWVNGLNDADLYGTYGTVAIPDDARYTWGDRLDYYRDLLQTPIAERLDNANEEAADVGHVSLMLTGKGIGTQMGYRFETTNPELKAAKPRSAAGVVDLIFSVENYADAVRVAEIAQVWVEAHPEDAKIVGWPAEGLAMFIAAHEPEAGGVKAFEEHLHPRDSHGRFAEVAGGGLGEITAGRTEAGHRGNNALTDAFYPLDPPGRDQDESAAILKTANVERIGAVLVERAKDDPALRAQIRAVGNRLIEAYSGPGAEEYLRDHLHIDTRGPLVPHDIGAAEIAARLQDTWMESASNASQLSWALQLAVADKLGIDASGSRSYLKGVLTGPGQVNELQGMGTFIPDALTREDPITFLDKVDAIASSPAVRAYVDQVYGDTQDYLRERGITEVTTYRGVSFFPAEDVLRTQSAEPQDREVTLNPLSSFSTSETTAKELFAVGQSGPVGAQGYVLEATVPVERVFSLPMTGPGCLRETEMLVAGGAASARVTPVIPKEPGQDY